MLTIYFNLGFKKHKTSKKNLKQATANPIYLNFTTSKFTFFAIYSFIFESLNIMIP